MYDTKRIITMYDTRKILILIDIIFDQNEQVEDL